MVCSSAHVLPPRSGRSLLARSPVMDLEEALKLVGEFGPYQKRAVAVLVLTQVSGGENRPFVWAERPEVLVR